MLVSPSSSSMLFQACNSNSGWVLLDNNMEMMMMEPQDDEVAFDDEVDHMYRYNNEQQQQQVQLKISPEATATTPPPTMTRRADDSTTRATMLTAKLNHRVRERDRRKKLNHLYASLRSLLPPTPHMKQQSIPATVSRILDYIPELKHQVEILLLHQKQLLLSQITTSSSTLTTNQHSSSDHAQLVECKNTTTRSISSSTSTNTTGTGIAVCVSRLNENNEVCVHISQQKISCLLLLQLSEVITAVENVEGYFLINASSFQGTTTIFYTLHLQAERNMVVECEVLREKMLSLGALKNKYIGRGFNF